MVKTLQKIRAGDCLVCNSEVQCMDMRKNPQPESAWKQHQ